MNICGLLFAAGFKEAFWPKVLAIGGIVIMVVGGVARTLMPRRRPGSNNEWAARREALPVMSDVEVGHE